MRSSAFDASEKPVVGGKLTASKIAVIGDGLAAKLKPSPLPLKPGADFNTGPDAEEATRFAFLDDTQQVVHGIPHAFSGYLAGRLSVAVCLAVAADLPPGMVFIPNPFSVVLE